MNSEGVGVVEKTYSPLMDEARAADYVSGELLHEEAQSLAAYLQRKFEKEGGASRHKAESAVIRDALVERIAAEKVLSLSVFNPVIQCMV